MSMQYTWTFSIVGLASSIEILTSMGPDISFWYDKSITIIGALVLNSVGDSKGDSLRL